MSFRVLYDLSLAGDSVGFSGIPQETRLLFSGLAQSGQIEVAGLLRPETRSDYRRRSLRGIDSQAGFVGPFLGHKVDDRSLAARVLGRVHPRLARAYQVLLQGGHITSHLEVADHALAEVIWRRFFASTVPPDARQLLAHKSYYLSKLGNDRIGASGLGLIPTPRLDTTGFDFLITQEAKPLKVHPSTVKVVRYHDGIPVTAPDTMVSDRQVRAHVSLVRKAAEDSVFVCNSTSALSDLAAISPKGASRSLIIPNVIPRMERTEGSRYILQTIAENRISAATLPEKRRRRALRAWLGDDPTNAVPQFIMGLSTIEPRKNFVRLVEAWREVRRRTGADVKLLIVGKPGWDYDETLRSMRPYVERGELLHLEGVRQAELPYLYSMATVFASISFAEGFGMPPTEAMQCGCPVVLSDVPAHQFMAEDAALYCDPYDIQSVATALEFSIASSEVRQLLVERGHRNVKRFTIDALLPAWENLFSQAAPLTRQYLTSGLDLPGGAAVWGPRAPAPAIDRNIDTLLRAARSEAGKTSAEIAAPVSRAPRTKSRKTTPPPAATPPTTAPRVR